jgi:hypothetical protein
MKSLVLTLAFAFALDASGGDGLTAFSLGEARRQVAATGPRLQEAETLAGMTRLLGLVYDEASRDVILVGRREQGGQPLDLPSLAVAIRAVVERHEWPLVSIDPGPDTEKTRKQRVRLEGGIENSQFGLDFLHADVRLKRLGLGLDSAPGLDQSSYFHLRARAAAANPGVTGGSSRFWFYAIDPGLEQRDGVFLIRRLQLGVRAQTLQLAGGNTGAKDKAALTFADKLTNSFDQLEVIYPELARLDGLYEMVAVARGIDGLPGDVTDYWLRQYDVPAVKTPAEFDLIGRQETIRTPAGPRYFEVSGGIQFSALTIRLLDGDISALRDAVLLARHGKDQLSWSVPVGGDGLQTGQPIPLAGYPAPADTDAGAHLSWATGSPNTDSEKRKAALKDAVNAIEAGLKRPAFDLKPLPLPEPSTTGAYHTSDGGKTNYLANSTLEASAKSSGMYHSEDGGATWKVNETPSLTKGSLGTLCITASCVGPRKAASDGLRAEPYAYGDLNPYSTHRYFEAGYSVNLNGKVISSGWGDVKLLGGGAFAAKGWNGPGYHIMDETGKQVSTRTFNNV